MLSWLVQIRMWGQKIQPQSQHNPPHQHVSLCIFFQEFHSLKLDIYALVLTSIKPEV